MARPGLIEHRKFRRFCSLLGIPEAHGLGLLEFLWRTSYESGNPFLGDSVDVEAAARWTGEPGRCCAALLQAGGQMQAGFIDELEDRPGQYQVHDLFDHAPEYVRKRLRRETERRSRGRETAALAGSGNPPVQSLTGQRPVSVQSEASTCAPAPAPAPVLLGETYVSPRREACAELEPAVLVFACRPGAKTKSHEWPLTRDLLDELERVYPAMDVLGEIQCSRLWLDAHPEKRKTYDGMRRYIVGWLARANDAGRYLHRPALKLVTSERPRRPAVGDLDQTGKWRFDGADWEPVVEATPGGESA